MTDLDVWERVARLVLDTDWTEDVGVESPVIRQTHSSVLVSLRK